jgi:pyruvate dehydrogenase E2 component (dihydrolipoamide acetyltransferase)
VPEREFKLPDLGEGLTEGEVVRWLVAEGDSIVLNQPIVEVETAKAVVEIPAPYAGTVVKLHAGEGDSLDVGAPLISVDTGGGAATAPDPDQELQATLVGPGERQQARRRRIAGHARGPNGPAARIGVPLARVGYPPGSGAHGPAGRWAAACLGGGACPGPAAQGDPAGAPLRQGPWGRPGRPGRDGPRRPHHP